MYDWNVDSNNKSPAIPCDAVFYANILQSLLGMCNYYQRFIKEWWKKSRVSEEMWWKSMCDKSFQDMRNALTEALLPEFLIFGKEFKYVSFDTKGAVLSQKVDKWN